MCLAIPGKVVRIDPGALTMGEVDFGGVRRDVCLAYTPEVKVGDFVLVHVGFAITIVDQLEAEKVMGYLDEIGELI